jgi:hypothetical protein
MSRVVGLLTLLWIVKLAGPLLEPVRTIGHLQRRMCQVTPTCLEPAVRVRMRQRM